MVTFLHAVEKESFLPSPAYSNSALALAKNEIAKRVSAGAIKTQKGKGKQRKFLHSEYMGHDAYAQRQGLDGVVTGGGEQKCEICRRSTL